jgi:flavodoxin
MRAVVIYESLTGNTRRAAGFIAQGLEDAGVTTTVCPVTAVDFAALSDADVVVVGSWTDGVFVVGQRPGRAGRLRALPAMKGKRVVVYCTYALNAGKVLQKMTAILEERGAEVIGGMTIRRDDLRGGSVELVNRLLSAVAA